jgi:ATP-binding cassette subfamily C (CFTR/MRP) protein 1
MAQKWRFSQDPYGSESEEAMETALTRVGLSLPGGLDMLVREGGANFSGGQRQLLCLARTLLRRSKVLVLDEATSSVSPELDLQVQRALRDAFGGVTKLVIAHRLATVLDASALLIMANGKVRKTASFLSFPYVCPEPVLAK